MSKPQYTRDGLQDDETHQLVVEGKGIVSCAVDPRLFLDAPISRIANHIVVIYGDRRA